ncbi:Serine hydrolase OS=Lysinibacillus sphaericus OX=1421 GN=LS41612_20605 PE=4 SV=1 [Lysinibacillus sphaericus]
MISGQDLFPTYQGQLAESVNVIGTGGISSTAEDVVQFSQIFMGQEKGILSDKAVQAMEQEEYKKGM